MQAPSRLAYLYLLRNPLLLVFFLVGFPYYAGATPGGHSLARGAFDLAGWQAFLAALAAFLAGWIALICSRLILLYGEERFGVSKLSRVAGDYPSPWMVVPASLLGVPAVWTMASVYVVEHGGASAFRPVILPGIGGFAVPIILLYGMIFLHRLFRHTRPDHLVFPRLPGFLEAPLDYATGYRWPYPFSRAFRWLQGFGPGYFVKDDAGQPTGELKPGHGYTLAVTIACLTAYAIIGYSAVNALACLFLMALLLCLILSATSFLFDYFRIPAALVILFWMYLVAEFGRLLVPLLGLSALALWLARRSDRGRLYAGDNFFLRHPLGLATGIILAFVWAAAYVHLPFPNAGFWPGRSEHYFQVKSLKPEEIQEKENDRNLPYDVLYFDQISSDPIAILVAAPGGGIHAAAWTAKVLVELEKTCRNRVAETGLRSFSGNIRLISSVSGGSVGTMYFVNAYDDKGQLPPTERLDYIVQYAEASSLDPAVKGLVYPDFLRSAVPYFDDVAYGFRQFFGHRFGRSDRGQWLQDAWVDAPKRVAASSANGSSPVDPEEATDDTRHLEEATLAKWRHDVSLHMRPAVIFNASNADTGGRYLLATTSFGRSEDGIATAEANQSFREGRLEFAREHPNLTVKVATAARLSATFPYVSPAACADLHDLRDTADAKINWRLGDGGYTNNSGLNSLGEWLEDALQASAPTYPILHSLKWLGAIKQALLASTAKKPPVTPRILILKIRNGEPGEVKSLPPMNGWGFQLLAPLTTLVNVWSYGQTPHDDWELTLLSDQQKALGIKIVPFTYSKSTVNSGNADGTGGQPSEPASVDQDVPLSNPLSWHLTPREKSDIETAWRANLSQVEEVINFMKIKDRSEPPAVAPANVGTAGQLPR